jgi:hypothetical protein
MLKYIILTGLLLLVGLLALVSPAQKAWANGGQPSSGQKAATTIAGPTPQNFTFQVAGNQLTWFDEEYTWDPEDQRYERGAAWVSFNTEGGGWQYQPAGGSASAGSYSPN